MTDINAWNAVDDSNNVASPAGWPEGMMPSGVNNSARAMMGSIKRWRDQANPTLTATGSANAQVITYPVAPATLVQGDTFAFFSVATNTGPATLQVNAQAPKNIISVLQQPLVGGEMPVGAVIRVHCTGTNFRLASDPGALKKNGDTMTGALVVTGDVDATDVNASHYVYALGGLMGIRSPTSGGTAMLAFESAVPGTVGSVSYDSAAARVTLTNNLGSGGYASVLSDGNFQIGGGAYKPGGGVWSATSDKRTKRNIETYAAGLAEIGSLRPVKYFYNGRGETEDDDRQCIGLVADDVRPVMPEMVGVSQRLLDVGDKETTEMLTLDATPLIFALVNAVQELTGRVKQLETALIK